MLEHPVIIRRLSFKMAHRERKITLLDWFMSALTSDSHDASRRRPQQFPFTVSHRIQVHFPEKGLGRPREL